MNSESILTLLILIPLVGSLAILFIPKGKDSIVRTAGLVVSIDRKSVV